MGQVLIRNLDDGLIEDYRLAARGSGRSLEAELRDGLARARPGIRMSRADLVEASRVLRARNADLTSRQTGSELIREDRDGYRAA